MPTSALFPSCLSLCVCVCVCAETWVCALRLGCVRWDLGVCARLLSRVQLFATPWTVAHQAPLNFSVHSDVPDFYTNFLFLFKDSIKETTLPLVIMSPESHRSATISGSYVSPPWQFWGVLVRNFVESPSVWGYLMFLFLLDWSCGFLGKVIYLKI